MEGITSDKRHHLAEIYESFRNLNYLNVFACAAKLKTMATVVKRSKKFNLKNSTQICSSMYSKAFVPLLQKLMSSNQIAIHRNSVMKKSNNIWKKLQTLDPRSLPQTFCTWNFCSKIFFSISTIAKALILKGCNMTR